MSIKSIGLSEDLYGYMVGVGLREPDVLRELRRETADHPLVNMQISPDQGAFMAMLVRLMGARRCIEVGVFTGYSSTAVALALPPDGRLIACDINADYARIAEEAWRRAAVADRIELRLAPAVETLDALLAEGAEGSFDFAFIDADKESYEAYYQRCLRLLRPGGMVVVDIVLWSGRVADLSQTDPDTVALREFNAERAKDQRVDLVMLPVADGLSLLRKR